ncbi:MAG: hypothetical protein KBT36_13515 [Kurthia sp.]|nr:hypothetical protein [Candidatus Kurthia equi]
MTLVCDCKEIKQLKIEADMGADPIWCATCHYNFDLEDIDLSGSLKKDLFSWVNDYASWVDWTTETLIEGQEKIEMLHNERGEVLTKLVQQALDGQYKVLFSPSEMY